MGAGLEGGLKTGRALAQGGLASLECGAFCRSASPHPEAPMRRTRWTRWTRSRLTAAVTLALLACGKSATKKAAEVRECSAITMDAKGAAQCLVLQYKWKQTEALTAATAFQQHEDSINQSRADSSWRADAGRHAKEAAACAKDPSGEVSRCLVGYGWADAR